MQHIQEVLKNDGNNSNERKDVDEGYLSIISLVEPLDHHQTRNQNTNKTMMKYNCFSLSFFTEDPLPELNIPIFSKTVLN